MTNPNQQSRTAADIAAEQAADASPSAQTEKRQPVLSNEGMRTIFEGLHDVDNDIQQLIEDADKPVFK